MRQVQGGPLRRRLGRAPLPWHDGALVAAARGGACCGVRAADCSGRVRRDAGAAGPEGRVYSWPRRMDIRIKEKRDIFKVNLGVWLNSTSLFIDQ